MKSLKSHEGYLFIDNSCGPGVSDELIKASGKDIPLGLGRGRVEIGTYTCSHCHTVVVLNPDRQRNRNYCRRCDHLICDSVACNAGCRPLHAYIDELREKTVLAEQAARDPTAIIIP